VEKGEHQHETVKREVKEEVGLDVAAIEKICAIHSHDKRYLLNFWTTEILSGEATIMSEEIAALRWVTIEEMRQLVPVFEEDVQVFEQIKNRS
jgi:8-oxo-dGTP pyrophosphatase MutT (NUDIX family)